MCGTPPAPPLPSPLQPRQAGLNAPAPTAPTLQIKGGLQSLTFSSSVDTSQ